MLKKSFLVAAAVLVVACSENPEKEMLKFPVKEVADLPQAVSLTPEMVPMELLTPYLFSINVIDGKLLTNADLVADHCVDAYDVNSGEFLAGLCRKGRGPGEFIGALPHSVTDGALIVLDTGTISEVSLAEDTFGDVLHQVRLREPKVGYYPIIASAYKLVGGDVLIYNSIQSSPEFVAIENPCYAIYDWESGEEKRLFELFDAAKVPEMERTFAFDTRDCVDVAGTTLCFVMGRMPVFAFLDIASGRARGFRLKGEPAFTADIQQQFFTGVCAQDKFIYALYGPEEKSGRTTLYKLDWEGNLLNQYALAGLYINCYATPDKLYLIGDYEGQNAVYQLDMKDL